MATKENMRDIALDIILRVTRDGEKSHILLKQVLDKYAYLDKQDRSFLKRLVMGTIERIPELDYVINQYSSVKTGKMKPVIRCILRLTVYQILYMDAVPDRAAINEGVNLAGKRGFKNLKGFVNGVLRSIGREKDNISYPDKKDFTAYMEARYSIPDYLTKLWLLSYSEEEIEGMGQAFLKSSPVTVRVNSLKTSSEELIKSLAERGIKAELYEEDSNVIILTSFDSLERIPEFNEGLFYVQDLSSMNVARAILPKAGEKGLDVCGAPGGKSMHAAILMENQGSIVTRDLTDYKVDLILDNVERMGLNIIEAEAHDALVLDEDMVGKMDFVIADLPCSGLGVLKRKPDIKYNTDLEKVMELSKLQQEILTLVSRYVKKGGRMVYSTCTLNRYENRDNVRLFIENNKEFSIAEEKEIMPNERQDGFYYCLLRKD